MTVCRYGARLVLSRDLTDYELATLRELFEKALAESGAGMVEKGLRMAGQHPEMNGAQ